MSAALMHIQWAQLAQALAAQGLQRLPPARSRHPVDAPQQNATGMTKHTCKENHP